MREESILWQFSNDDDRWAVEPNEKIGQNADHGRHVLIMNFGEPSFSWKEILAKIKNLFLSSEWDVL